MLQDIDAERKSRVYMDLAVNLDAFKASMSSRLRSMVVVAVDSGRRRPLKAAWQALETSAKGAAALGQQLHFHDGMSATTRAITLLKTAAKGTQDEAWNALAEIMEEDAERIHKFADAVGWLSCAREVAKTAKQAAY